MAFQPFAPEIIYRPVVGGTVARQPHEMDIFPQSPFYLAARIDIAQISVKQYFYHHPGMKTCGTTAFILADDVVDV